jgi:hypothetical protein
MKPLPKKERENMEKTLQEQFELEIQKLEFEQKETLKELADLVHMLEFEVEIIYRKRYGPPQGDTWILKGKIKPTYRCLINGVEQTCYFSHPFQEIETIESLRRRVEKAAPSGRAMIEKMKDYKTDPQIFNKSGMEIVEAFQWRDFLEKHLEKTQHSMELVRKYDEIEGKIQRKKEFLQEAESQTTENINSYEQKLFDLFPIFQKHSEFLKENGHTDRKECLMTQEVLEARFSRQT